MKLAAPPAAQTELLATWKVEAVAELPGMRSQLRRAVNAAADADAAAELVMLVDELASNGFRHGSPPVHITVLTTATGWLVTVTDTDSDRAPVEAVGRDPALGGLGLYMVAALGNDGGWYPGSEGKTVWATITATT